MIYWPLGGETIEKSLLNLPKGLKHIAEWWRTHGGRMTECRVVVEMEYLLNGFFCCLLGCRDYRGYAAIISQSLFLLFLFNANEMTFAFISLHLNQCMQSIL